MKSTLICLLISFTLSAPIAMARNLSITDGNMLLKECHAAIKAAEVSPQLTAPEWQAAAHCMGFIQGVMDADQVWYAGISESSGANAVKRYCVPDDATWSQLVMVVVKWLENNPADLNQAGYVHVERAMANSYPCGVRTH
jgi:hypothetical protein